MSNTKLRLATSVPGDFLEVLGAISVNFGALENALSLSIWFLLARPGVLTEERHQIVTAQLSFKQLVWMFASLYKDRFPSRNGDVVDDYVKQCFDAEGKRNQLIHSLWVDALPRTSCSAATRLKPTARSDGFKLKTEHHTKEQFIEVANELTTLSYNIRSFIIGETLTQFEAPPPN